jgi:hypothetical protein
MHTELIQFLITSKKLEDFGIAEITEMKLFLDIRIRVHKVGRPLASYHTNLFATCLFHGQTTYTAHPTARISTDISCS